MRLPPQHHATRWLGSALMLATVCCIAPGCVAEDPLVPVIDSAVRFAELERVRVERGDTIAAIAQRYDVTVADIAAWNKIDPDHIEVGQLLSLWRQRSPTPNLTERVPWEHRYKSNAPNTSQLASALGADPPPASRPATKRAGSTSGRARSASSRGGPVAAAPPADALSTDDVADATADDDGSAADALALLGALDGREGLDAGLRDNLSGMSGRTGAPGRAGISGRSGGLAARGDVEASAAVDRPQVQTMGAIIPNTPITAPRLAKPAAKRCLSQPSGAGLREEGIDAGRGLSSTQVKSVLTAFVRQTRACIPAGTSGKFTVRVELDVGCNGIVAGSRVVSSSPGVPDGLSRCVADTLHYASFPAHDLPDGATFQYPINFAY